MAALKKDDKPKIMITEIQAFPKTPAGMPNVVIQYLLEKESGGIVSKYISTRKPGFDRYSDEKKKEEARAYVLISERTGTKDRVDILTFEINSLIATDETKIYVKLFDHNTNMTMHHAKVFSRKDMYDRTEDDLLRIAATEAFAKVREKGPKDELMKPIQTETEKNRIFLFGE